MVRNSIIREQLESLAALRQSNRVQSVPCKVCSKPAIAFDVVDFNKICDMNLYPFGFVGIAVTYYRCEACSFVFTTFFDEWSTIEFSKYIYNQDYILVDPEYTSARPERMATALADILRGCEETRILDYGSGSGAFAALMMSSGFAECHSYDPFSAPERPVKRFDIITCFEVIEHTVSPMATVEDMLGLLAPGGAILISTTLQPSNITEIRGNFWYIAPRNGHVSIFAAETFAWIATRFGLACYIGRGICGFAGPVVQPAVRAALERIGPAFNGVVLLVAPIEDDDSYWNQRELWNTMISFRWTRSPEVAWPTHRFLAGTTKIRIRYLMEIAPGFAQKCQVFLGAEQLPTEVIGDCITATATLREDLTGTIRLVTPPLRIPQESGKPDPRSLGLAVPVGERAP